MFAHIVKDPLQTKDLFEGSVFHFSVHKGAQSTYSHEEALAEPRAY